MFDDIGAAPTSGYVCRERGRPNLIERRFDGFTREQSSLNFCADADIIQREDRPPPVRGIMLRSPPGAPPTGPVYRHINGWIAAARPPTAQHGGLRPQSSPSRRIAAAPVATARIRCMSVSAVQLAAGRRGRRLIAVRRFGALHLPLGCCAERGLRFFSVIFGTKALHHCRARLPSNQAAQASIRPERRRSYYRS